MECITILNSVTISNMNWDVIDDPMTELTSTNEYTMITSQIAVGSLYSSYDAFDIVVNMAYRYDGNGFMKHQLTHTRDKNKTVIRIGLHDTPTEPLDMILPIIVPILLIALQEGKRLLIHCQAGMSRSASVAIAVLAIHESMTFIETLDFIKSKRPIIQPNPSFLRMVEKYIKSV